jgi:quinol monooxygenase YgiN
MRFIQFIEFETSDIAAFRAEVKKWETDSAEWRTATRATLSADRDRPGNYVQIVEFPSYEAAMANSNDPRTAEFAARLAKMTNGAPGFRNLDVLQIDEF